MIRSIRRGLILSGLCAVSVSISPNARACDFCMLGQGVSPYLTATGKGLTLDATYTESDHVYNGATEIPSQGKKEAWLIYSLTGFFPVTDDLTVLITLPYAVKTNVDFDDASGLNTGTLTTGIGDMTLTGRYTLFREHTLATTLTGGLLGGFKFPTGTTNNRDARGNPVDRHALPGTGSFDYHVGFTGAYVSAGGFQLTTDVVYNISGDGDWADRDHRYGDSLNYSVKAYYRVWPETPGEKSFLPFVGVSGESQGEERGSQLDSGYQPDTMNLSSGGTVLYANVGLYGVLNINTMLNLMFAKAFYRHMNYSPDFDTDPAENYRLAISLTYLF